MPRKPREPLKQNHEIVAMYMLGRRFKQGINEFLGYYFDQETAFAQAIYPSCFIVPILYNAISGDRRADWKNVMYVTGANR